MTYNLLTLSFTGEWKHLESMGYTVNGFSDSLLAVEYFSEHPDQFDLIITDFSMPGMTGLNVSKKILDTRRDIPIILYTGYSKNITQQKIKVLGIKAFLMKPITKHSLSITMRNVLNTERPQPNMN